MDQLESHRIMDWSSKQKKRRDIFFRRTLALCVVSVFVFMTHFYGFIAIAQDVSVENQKTEISNDDILLEKLEKSIEDDEKKHNTKEGSFLKEKSDVDESIKEKQEEKEVDSIRGDEDNSTKEKMIKDADEGSVEIVKKENVTYINNTDDDVQVVENIRKEEVVEEVEEVDIKIKEDVKLQENNNVTKGAAVEQKDTLSIESINDREQEKEVISTIEDSVQKQIITTKSNEEENNNEEMCGGTVFSNYKKNIYKKVQSDLLIATIALSDKNDVIIIINTSDQSIDITRWHLRKRTKGKSISTCKDTLFNTSDNICTFGSKGCGDGIVVIPAQSQIIIARDESVYANSADFVRKKTISDNNSIVLLDDNRVLRDMVVWGSGHRDSDFYKNSIANPEHDEYIAHTSKETIIKKQCEHDILRTEPCKPIYAGEEVRINEMLPNPSGDESVNEYIELYNPGTKTVNLHGWTVGDATTSGRYTFPYGTKIAPKQYHLIKRDIFGFALNNSNESVTLWAPSEDSDVVVDFVAYKQGASEDVSLNHQSAGIYRWSKTLTPNAQNIFNNIPIIKNVKIDKKIYKNVTAHFSVDAADGDNEKLSYRWNFGDGHKSYKKDTTHKYDTKGMYSVELRVQDESEEITRRFSVKVEKYSRKNKVKIIAIAPNPYGKDSGEEYILIKNTSSKKINFSQWSIATGSTKKKLVNHPVRKELKLKAGEEKKISTEYSAITLPNKGGFIEIRRPDGSVAHDKEYTTPDEYKSVPENARYLRQDKSEGSGWLWDLSDVPAQSTKKNIKKSSKKGVDWSAVNDIIAQAWQNEFGSNDNSAVVENIAPLVRGASIRHNAQNYEGWYTLVTAWVNRTLARVAQSVTVYAHTVQETNRESSGVYIIDINRNNLSKNVIHPATVALAITGLIDTPMDELLHNQGSL